MRRFTGLLVAVVCAAGLVPAAPAVSAAPASATGRAPVVSSISPTLGYSTGGELVRVHGRNLANVSRVYFGLTPARLLRTEAGGTLVVQTPRHAPATVYVRVFTKFGSSPATMAARYRWISTVASTSSTSPSRGSTAGGTLVWVRGDSLVHVRGVYFGAVAARIVSYGTGSAMLVRTPAHPAGPVPVRVRTVRGLTPLGSATRYTYAGALTVSGVRGTADGTYLAGADEIEVDGPYFSPQARVMLDGRQLTTGRASDTTLFAALPADLPTGQHLISVRDEIGTSATRPIQVVAPWRRDDSGPAPGGRAALVDCAAADACVAVADGYYSLLDSTGWHPADGLVQPQTLACASARDCLAVVSGPGSSGAAVLHFDGTTWAAAADAPAIQTVSCSADGTCVALTGRFDTWLRAPDGRWTDTGQALPSSLGAVRLSCRSATDCVAAGAGPVVSAVVGSRYDTRVWFWDGQGWSPSAIPPSDAAHVFAGCADTFCVAATDAGDVYMSTDRTTWTQRRAWPVSDAMTAVDCSPQQCVAVDEHGRATVVAAGQLPRRNLAEPVSRTTFGFDYSVTCPSDDLCAAGAVDGVFLGPVG